MQAALTERLIKSLRPDENGPYEVRDTKLQGFLLRVQPSGVMSYVCQYRRGRRETLGRVGVTTLGLARKRAIEILSAEHNGGYVPVKKQLADDVGTLGAFLDKEYVPWFKAHRRPPYSNLNNLSAFTQYRDRELADLEIRLLERWSAKRIEKGNSPATVKRYLNTLYAVLSKAVEWGVIDKHPLKGMAKLKIDDLGRTRFLSAAEETNLLKALNDRERRMRDERDSANAWRKSRGFELYPDLKKLAYTDYLKPIVLLAKNTGMRKGEILALRWSDVNLKNGLLTVRGATAKSSKTRHIPLNSIAHDVLKNWHKQSSGDYLFQIGDFKRAWLGLLKTANIENFKFHDLRHDFASKLVMAGVDLRTVQELLGHADMTMTLRYAHLAPSHKAAAVEMLTEKSHEKR